jgi:hypothetical protein
MEDAFLVFGDQRQRFDWTLVATLRSALGSLRNI